TIPPKKKLAAVSSWQRSWATLRRFSEESNQVDLASTALDIPDLNSAIEGLGLNAIRLSDLLKYALTRAVRAFYSWRVRPLHRIAERYPGTPYSERSHPVARIFRVRATADDLQSLQTDCGCVGKAQRIGIARSAESDPSRQRRVA